MATEGNISEDFSATSTGVEGRYSTTAQLDSNPNGCFPAESIKPNKLPTENICKSEHCEADKMENQAQTQITENEKQHQEGVLIKDVETGDDKVEAINDIYIEETDHDKEDDGAKISRTSCAEELNPKVHEEESSVDNSSLDRHLERTTDQHASLKVIPESIVDEENTRSKGEEVAALECNEQATSISETNLDLVNEAILPKLYLKTKSQGEENGRVIGSCTKDEDTETTMHVEDEIKEIYLTRVQDKKADMPYLPEGEWKDPESNGSSNKLERDNNREEDASTVNGAQSPHVHNVEESTLEAASENGKNDNDNGEDQDGGKEDSWQKKELEDEHREQIILIPEETEIAASRENAEKRVEQNIHPVENFEEKEEKDGGETSISTDKSLPLAESIEEIKSEESIFPPKNANDLNSEGPMVEETVQPDSGEIGIVSKTDAEEKHQESSKFCTENNEHDEHCSETHSTENLIIKHTDSETIGPTETITKSTMHIEEHEKVPESNSEEKIDIKVDEKIISEEPKEMEEADKQSCEIEKQRASEDEAPSRSSITALIGDETIEKSIEQESLKDGESTLIEINDTQKLEDAEEEKNAAEAFYLPKSTGGQETGKQQIVEGSVDETKNNFEDDEKDIRCSRDDTGREFKEENYVIDVPPEFNQNTGLEEKHSTVVQLDSNPKECSLTESEISLESSSADKSPTENICRSEHSLADKTENKELTETSENERQNKKGLQIKDVETGGDKVEVINDVNIEKPDHDNEDDGAKMSMLTCAEEEETSTEISSIDQHLELITDQHASFKETLESVVKDENTRSKGEVNADLAYSETNLGLVNEDLLPNLDLKTKSQGEEDEREIESSTKDEDTKSTIHVEDEFNEICLAGEQNKIAEMPSVLEGEQKKDPEPTGSSEENVAESPCVQRVEESTFEDSSRNGDNDNDKSEDESSNLVKDGGSTKVVIETGETLQETSYTAEKDKNNDVNESERQQIDVCPVDKMAKEEDLACLNREVREHEEGLTETNEVGKINSEGHEGKKRDSWHKNEQEVELEEQVILIPEKTEIEAPIANAQNGVEQNIQQIEKFEDTEHREKSLPLAESIIEIKREERIFPPTIANDLNSEGPLIEGTEQPDSGETGEVSKSEVEDKVQESNKFFIENNEHDEHGSEKQSIENLAIKHTDSEATVTTETTTKSTKDVEELEKVSESLAEEKIDIKDDEKIIPEEPKEMEEATYKQPQETAKESASEDEATSRLPTTALISDETIEQSIKEESLKDGESTLEEKNDSHKPENDAEEKKKAPEAFDQPKSTGEQETAKQHIVGGSVDETKINFEDNEKEIQCSSDDTGREFKEEHYVTDLPHEFIQNTGLEERYPTAVQLDRNPKECYPAESESSVDSFSADKSPTENISRPEHSLANKKENEELTEISENESKNQEGLQIKDDEREGDDVEAIIDKIIEEPDRDIENDSAKISMLTFSEEPNLKVHEEETSTEISFIDQHLELTDQQASFKVIPERVVKDENTISKGEEDAVLEYNLQDERDIESSTKDEHTANTIHVEDEFNEICLAVEQNKEAEMPSVLEDERKKDPEPIGSSDNLEHENNREEDASAENVAQSPCFQRVEESTFEAASRKGYNDDDKSEDKSSNLVTDGGSTEVVIEAGETLQEASYTADRDKNKDIYESDQQQIDVCPVDKMAKSEDLACLSGDVRGIHEEGLTETNEVGKINPESHEGEKRNSWHKNEDVELGEHVILIPKKTESAAPRENAENGVEQNIQMIEKFEETEEKDEPTSTHDTGETSISTKKSLPLAESITEIKSEERILPQKNENDSNPEGQLVEEIGQPESGEESKTEAEEKHQDASKICTENEKDEHCSETKRTENLDIKHTDLEAMVTEETITTSSKDAEELEQVPESHYEKKKDIKGDEKVIPEAPKEIEEATDKQSHETAKESAPEDEALARLSPAELIRDETFEQSTEEESLKDTELTLIEKNDSHRPENTAEENKNAVEAFDLPKATDGLDICKQQNREGSVEETMKNFKDNEKEIQSSREDTDRKIKDENYVPDLPREFIQNTELEERDLSTVQLDSNTKECSTAEHESSVDLSSHDQSPTEYICTSEHCQADKIENEELTGISENERQNQNGVLSKDVETGGDKVINDINIEEPGHDIKIDVAKISMLPCAEQSNLKVQEEETSMENSSLDQHLELITDQFPESIEKDKNTRSNGEEDAVLECNEKVTSTSEINVCKINEVSLPNLDLTTKSQGEEDEREKEYCTKDEGIDTTIHVDDEFKEISLTGVQNKKAEIPPVMEFEWKDPEHIRSSSNLEHDNNKEEDASSHRFEKHPFEIASRNGDNDDVKSENQSSNLVADETNTQVAIEAGETLQEASYTACKDENKDVVESVRQEIGVLPVEDSACLNRDVRAEKEDDIIQMGLTETYENDKINLEKHDGEKRDSWQKNEQEDELGEQVILIPEKTEITAPRDNAEKIVQQDVHRAENFDEKEEKDEPTSTPDTRETSIPTEKSPTLVEPVTKTKSEELNSKYLLVEEAGQPDNDETGEVSTTDAEETHQEPGEFSTENSKQDEHHSETQSTENFAIKHTDSEAMAMTETITKSTKDTEELEKVTESHSEEKIDIKGDEKIIPEEPKDMEEATDKQSHKTAKESVSEDEAPSRLSIEASIRDETVEQSFQEESLHGELTFIEKESHRPENDAEENIKVIEAEAFDLPKTTGREDTSKQQIIEGSVEEKMNNFQENEKEIQSSMEDTGREIKGTRYIPHLPPEFIKNAEVGEKYLVTTPIDSNPNECSSAESKSSVEPSSPDKSPTENIHISEHFQADKIEDQPLTNLSENERQHQKGATCKDVETGSDKVEAIIEKNIEKDHDHSIENDGAKIPQLACPEKPNPKVHEEETSIDNTSLDRHLELITDQQATSDVIAESMEKEMITPHTNENTRSKGEENVDLECNEQATSISKTNLCLVTETLLPNLDLKTKSQGEEYERVIESCTKEDDTDTTIHVENEFNKISLAGVENKKAEMLSVPEDEGKDPESIRSSDKLEHEDNREEDASTVNAEQSPYAHKVEESTIEAASINGNEDDDSSAIPSSNLITDGTIAPVKIDTAETLQEPSHAACQDKNKEIQESALEEVEVPPVDRMAKAGDSACLNKDVRGANEEDSTQTGLTESNEDSKIDPEKRDGEKMDSRKNNEEEEELEEQVTLIPEKTEVVSQTEDAEKRVEQNIHPGESFDEKEEKDRLTSTPDTGETSISTEKSFSPDESITKIKSEERTFPQIIVNDLNSKNPLVEGWQPDSGEISEVSKTEAELGHKAQSTENLVIKHTDLEALVTTETITKSSKNAEEPERVPESHSEEKKDIKGDEKIIQEEPKEMDEATDILFVETETPLITHTEGASILGSSDHKEKEKEYSNEGIQKQKDVVQPTPPDLKTENSSESETGYIIKGKREQVDGLADQNEASKIEIVEDEKSMTEVTKNIEVYTSMHGRKALLQEEELADKTEDSLEVTGVEREIAELKAESPSSEKELANTKASELLMEKGASVSVTQDQREDTLLHSSNNQTEEKNNNTQDQDSQSVQQVIKLRFQGDIEPNMKDEDLSNLPLAQDEDTKDTEFTQEVQQRLGTADNNENINEHPTEGRITSPQEETGNEVEVSTSEFTEHESTNLTEEKKPVTLEDHTEQNMDFKDFSALKFTHESETCTEVSSSTSKVYEKETELGFIKRDGPTASDPKNVHVQDEIEEIGIKNAEPGHVEYEIGSDLATESKGETSTTTIKISSDHVDSTEKEEENSKTEKKGISEELNEGHLKKNSCVEETDKTTTVQDERELATSSIPISQDYPKQLVEEKDAMHNASIYPEDGRFIREEITDETAEAYLAHSSENTSLQKEHEVVKLGGVTELESVEITNESSNEDSSKLENEGLHMVSDKTTNNSISDITSIAHHDDPCKSHTGKEENAGRKIPFPEDGQKDSSNEVHEKAGAPEVVIQLEHQEKGEKEKTDSLIESEQIKEATASEEATNLKTIEKTFEFVPEVHSYEVLMESEEKEKHIKRALTNLQPEENQSEITIAAGKTMNTQVSDEKIKEEQEAIKDFQQIYVAERDRASDQETEQSAMEYLSKKTNETLQTSSNDNQHEVKSEAIEKVEYENIKDNLPDDTEGKNVTEAAKSVTHENQGAETKITGGRTEVVASGEKEAGVSVEVSECTKEEIQKLEESSWEKVDINLTEKADVETRKLNVEDVQHRLQKEEESPQVDTYLDEAMAKTDGDKDDVEDENQMLEPLSGESAMVETSKDRDVKVAHKKSHNILSGVGSKVKHSISKVKKAITGKSSHPKTSSPK